MYMYCQFQKVGPTIMGPPRLLSVVVILIH